MAMNGNSSWDKIQQGVKDTERLIVQREYNESMVKARQTLEFMVNFMKTAGYPKPPASITIRSA